MTVVTTDMSQEPEWGGSGDTKSTQHLWPEAEVLTAVVPIAAAAGSTAHLIVNNLASQLLCRVWWCLGDKTYLGSFVDCLVLMYLLMYHRRQRLHGNSRCPDVLKLKLVWTANVVSCTVTANNGAANACAAVAMVGMQIAMSLLLDWKWC